MKLGQRTSAESEVVLDANVLVRMVVPGAHEAQAEAIWQRLTLEHLPCPVPSFCPTEVISSLRQMGRGGLLSAQGEEVAIADFLGRIRPALIPIDSPALSHTAWEMARDLNERHTYDSVYLAIARAFGMEFWTADQQLLRRLAGRFPGARFLGDYPLPPP
jgi:predicted nucleic acid-binding protein